MPVDEHSVNLQVMMLAEILLGEIIPNPYLEVCAYSS